MARIKLARIIALLEKHYGTPRMPWATDPWLLILWENVAYLADDERRQSALEHLERTIGTSPERIADASTAELLAVTQHGIAPARFVEKLQTCARVALEQFGGDVRSVLELPVAKAKKALQKFPGIGEPVAEKILVFAGAAPILALDSNGLRTLVRLGFAEEKKNYAATYRAVRESVAHELPGDCDWLARTHLLLQQHGRELCKRSEPLCHQCPLAKRCLFAGTSFPH
jgi:endonuclease III